MVLKQFSTAVEGNHAIALILFFRQSFDNRSHSKPCFSWRAEVGLCCSDTRELEQATCYTVTDGNSKWTFRVPRHQSSEKMCDSMFINSLICKQFTPVIIKRFIYVTQLTNYSPDYITVNT